MSVFDRIKDIIPQAQAAKPAVVHEEPAPVVHTPWGDWTPPGAQAHVPSLHHYVDEDVSTPHGKGAEYANQLVALSGTTNDKQGHYQILNLLESVNDPAVRHEMMQAYEKKTGKPLDQFLSTASWDGKRDKDEALSLISPDRDKADEKLASLPKDKRDEIQREAMAVAKTIDSTAVKDSADDKDNARKMADALAGKSPEEIEAIRAAIQTTTHGHQGTYELLDRSLSGGNENEAVAALRGDPVHTAIVGMFNATGDPKRAREILDRLDPKQMEVFKLNAPWMGAIAASMPEGERKEIELRMHGDRAAANADRIANLLKDPKDSFIEESSEKPDNRYDLGKAMELQTHAHEMYELRQPENLVRELEKMSPEELKAARAAYDPKEHGGKTLDQTLAERFDPKDVNGQRVAALLRGDRVGDKALELREGMRTHNQDAIEHALANDDLASKNPERHARGVAEQNELAARVQELDAPVRPSWMPALPNAPKGRALEQQLEDSYKDYVAGNTSADDPFQAQSQMAAMMDGDKRRDRVKDDRIANKELLEGGKLTLATELYRARGSAEQRADLLDETESNAELEEAKRVYKEKYGKDLLAAPNNEKWAFLARQRQMDEMMHGKERSLEEVESDIAFEDRDVNEQRIEQTRTEGVRAERTDDQLRHDQHEIYSKQHSERLEKVEQQREYFGGGIGSQHIWRENIEAMDAEGPQHHWWESPQQPQQQAAGEKGDLVHQLDKVAGADQQTAREEKIQLAERSAKIFTTIAKLGSFAVGGPVATAIFNGLVGLAGAEMKKSIGGEAIDMGKETKEVGVDFGTDLLTIGLNGEYKEAVEAREMEEALKAGKTLEAVGIKEGREEAQRAAERKLVGNVAGKMIGAEAQDKLVKDKSDHDTAVDVAGAGLGQILPGLFGGKVEHALGHAKVDESIAKGMGTVTEKVTDKSIEGVTESRNTDEEAKKEREKRKREDEELAKAKAEAEPEHEHQDI